MTSTVGRNFQKLTFSSALVCISTNSQTNESSAHWSCFSPEPQENPASKSSHLGWPYENTNPVSPRKPGDTTVLPEARRLSASHVAESLEVLGMSECVEQALLHCKASSSQSVLFF